ncbi:TetR/AcrR family transcriptional regulator [Prauserella muralis]|uniref:TetR family transcriptional regulator n=1 Tax=Prauserella muralis TaxID=588067 RepID=A0A2V4APP7_9PSEU|nr:TetR/AcrR family transcriptional regulator [Prauserella muralis]PXY22683.1 TetR family transcriptional regulator [Prauserella muralis]TWE28396.1 TetR family transcriptional regulator [Prauserella muralis]
MADQATEPVTTGSTRQRLLTVAERLLLDAGYDHVSVRAINAAAGANPAAVHYHFGSKDALVAALLEERLAPVWQDELRRLEQRRRGGWVPTVAELADVVLTPLADLAADPVGALRLHLLARVVLSGRRLDWTSRWFSLAPWIDLLHLARPDLSERQAAHRWALAFQLLLLHFGSPFGGTEHRPGVPTESLRAFVVAGLDAP